MRRGWNGGIDLLALWRAGRPWATVFCRGGRRGRGGGWGWGWWRVGDGLAQYVRAAAAQDVMAGDDRGLGAPETRVGVADSASPPSQAARPGQASPARPAGPHPPGPPRGAVCRLLFGPKSTSRPDGLFRLPFSADASLRPRVFASGGGREACSAARARQPVCCPRAATRRLTAGRPMAAQWPRAQQPGAHGGGSAGRALGRWAWPGLGLSLSWVRVWPGWSGLGSVLGLCLGAGRWALGAAGCCCRVLARDWADWALGRWAGRWRDAEDTAKPVAAAGGSVASLSTRGPPANQRRRRVAQRHGPPPPSRPRTWLTWPTWPTRPPPPPPDSRRRRGGD